MLANDTPVMPGMVKRPHGTDVARAAIHNASWQIAPVHTPKWLIRAARLGVRELALRDLVSYQETRTVHTMSPDGLRATCSAIAVVASSERKAKSQKQKKTLSREYTNLDLLRRLCVVLLVRRVALLDCAHGPRSRCSKFAQRLCRRRVAFCLENFCGISKRELVVSTRSSSSSQKLII